MKTGGQLARFASLSGIALVLVLVPALAAPACFKPNVQDGGFKCATGATPCPDGFKCEVSTNLCKRNPSDGGAGKGGKGGGAGGMGGVAGGGEGGTGGQTPCFDAMPNCEPSDAGICDPYCQSGCSDCHQKCSANTANELTCNTPTKSKLAGTLEACSISYRGTSMQADDCAQGNVCVDENVCFPRCFRFCRSDQDCDNSFCDRDVNGQKTCGIPYVDTCTPLMVGLNAGCSSGLACYISATHSEHTFCDCPQGSGHIGDDCARSVDCSPGLACAYILVGVGKATCRQVCDLSKNGTDCGVNGTRCNPYQGASGNGTANARWGFCSG
jgi:hypothetical protein